VINVAMDQGKDAHLSGAQAKEHDSIFGVETLSLCGGEHRLGGLRQDRTENQSSVQCRRRTSAFLRIRMSSVTP